MPSKRYKKTIKKAVKKVKRLKKKLVFKPKKRTIQRLKDASLIFLFFLELHLIAAGFFYHKYRQTILSFRVAPSFRLISQQREAEPVKLTISSQNIDLNVIPAQIVEGVWQTSDTALSHLETSARPGERGNTVIYGHNRWNILAKLKKVAIGDLITITSQDGSIRTYKVEEKYEVSPEQIETVLPTEEEVLTLYTCTGFLDSQRLIVKAFPLHRQFEGQD